MLIVAAVDDIDGITASYAIEKLLESGAKNVNVTQTITKKGRPGLMFFIDVEEEKLERLGEVIMAELGSIGYNVIDSRHIHSKNTVSSHRLEIKSGGGIFEGSVSVKSSFSPTGRLTRIDPESDDLMSIIESVKAKLGINLALRELKRKIQDDARIGLNETSLEIPNTRHAPKK